MAIVTLKHFRNSVNKALREYDGMIGVISLMPAQAYFTNLSEHNLTDEFVREVYSDPGLLHEPNFLDWMESRAGVSCCLADSQHKVVESARELVRELSALSSTEAWELIPSANKDRILAALDDLDRSIKQQENDEVARPQQHERVKPIK